MKFLPKFLFIFFIFTSYTFAADYGVVNFKEVLQQSKSFQSFQKQATNNKKAVETELNKESASLKNIETTISESRNQYSPDEFAKKKADFENQVIAFRKKFQTKQKSFESNNAEAMALIEQKLKECVVQIAKERKVEMIYRAELLGYYPSEKDFSKDVLKVFNKKLPSVSLKKA